MYEYNNTLKNSWVFFHGAIVKLSYDDDACASAIFQLTEGKADYTLVFNISLQIELIKFQNYQEHWSVKASQWL
jgi:hypothetical protein